MSIYIIAENVLFTLNDNIKDIQIRSEYTSSVTSDVAFSHARA